MPILFEWSDEYSVGHSVIDEQHRRLFELGNAIFHATLDEAVYFIDKIFEHAKLHFDFEEKHMKSINFPDLYRHIEIHNDLIVQLHEITRNPMETEEDFRKFKKFLYDWILDHIMMEDKKYATYAQSLS